MSVEDETSDADIETLREKIEECIKENADLKKISDVSVRIN